VHIIQKKFINFSFHRISAKSVYLWIGVKCCGAWDGSLVNREMQMLHLSQKDGPENCGTVNLTSVSGKILE